MLHKGTIKLPGFQLGTLTNQHMQLLWKDSTSTQEQQYHEKEGLLKPTQMLQFVSFEEQCRQEETKGGKKLSENEHSSIKTLPSKILAVF